MGILRASLLCLVLASCQASGPIVYELSLPAVSAPNRPVDDPSRIALRKTPDPAPGQRTEGEVARLKELGRSGCPEAWIWLLHRPEFVSGEQLMGRTFQVACLSRLAEAGPDHVWFGKQIARLRRSVGAAALGFVPGEREIYEAYGPALRRIAETAPHQAARAAAEGLLGRMLITGYLTELDSRDKVTLGAKRLRRAFEVWDAGVELPVSLGVRSQESSEVRRELEQLLAAAEGRSQGQALRSALVYEANGVKVRTDEVLRGQPALVVVWGFR